MKSMEQTREERDFGKLHRSEACTLKYVISQVKISSEMKTICSLKARTPTTGK